jgi:hypothetical protein
VESLPSKKKDPRKKRREQGLNSKRGETSYEELHVKKEDEIYKLLGEILSKEREKERKEITLSYSAKSDVWHHPLFLDFSFSYLHSLHHSPSTMIICHTNSLEFSFAFTIYKVYHRYLLRVNHHKNISREEKSDWEDE